MGILKALFHKKSQSQVVPLQQVSAEPKVEFVRLTTVLDDCVCPMCAQFKEKVFLVSDAPELPLCPLCRCAYEYYLSKSNLPRNTKISKKSDFVLPAKCTAALAKNHQQIYIEKDIKRKLALCEEGLKLLPEFMAPYLSAGFPAPKELACRDLAPELYMRLGDWQNALRVIQFCISANAYYPKAGEEELQYLHQYSETAEIAVNYIKEHPGLAQRDIYKKLCPPADREMLKKFTRYSLQIRKEPYQNTNRLYSID